MLPVDYVTIHELRWLVLSELYGFTYPVWSICHFDAV